MSLVLPLDPATLEQQLAGLWRSTIQAGGVHTVWVPSTPRAMRAFVRRCSAVTLRPPAAPCAKRHSRSARRAGRYR